MGKLARFKQWPSELLHRVGKYVCSGVSGELRVPPYSERLNLVQVDYKVTGRREFVFNM